MTEMATTSTQAPLLVIEAVSKRFPGVQALRDVSLVVNEAEVHALVGQNGAGKSTLVRCVSGVYAPDAGRIVLGGVEIKAYSPVRAYALGIAAVHQRPQLVPWLSVAENVLLGHMPTRGRLLVSRRDANAVTRSLLERFRLDIDPETPVARLAPAERQQVAIAKALFRRAKLLILDEPTAALDAEQAARLFALVRDLTAEGIGVLYVSHHLDEVFDLANRVTVLRDGELVATRPVVELSQDEVVTLMAGRRLDVVASSGAASRTSEPVVLAIEHLTTDVLHDIDLDVHAGEVVGITGVIGAGGHSIARVAFGIEKLVSGRLRLRGELYTPRGPGDAIRQGVFLVPEDPDRQGLVSILSLAKNVTMVDLGALTRHGLLSLRRERQIAERLVRDLGIATSSVDTLVRNLSGGNRQKVLLAKALAAGASLLVLEEPTQGVDVHSKAEIHRILRELAAGGKAVLVISTDIRDLLEFVDRVLALRAGRVVGDLPAADTSYAQVLDLTVGAAGAVAA
jgi:ABC-type sugar transport system ATPase subunit